MKDTNEIVDAFAEQMKVELKANEHKGDWCDFQEVEEIKNELEYHLRKLNTAIHMNSANSIKEHLADCGNFLMMIGNSFDLYND